MNTDDGSLDFDVYFNNKKFNSAVDESEKRVKGFSAATVAEGEKIDDAFKITAENIRIQKDVIAKLETEVGNLNIEISKLPKGSNAQNELKKQATELTAELNAEKSALKQLQTEVKATEEKHVTFRTQIRAAREELIRMEQAGLRGSPAYEAMQQKLGKLTDSLRDATSQANVLANDERGFQGVVATLSGVTGAFSAAQGAVGLFSGENENLQKIMLKVQSLMAITIGLQQVAQMLNKDSYFSIVMLTKAKTMWAAANLRVATTLGISTVAAQALMATLTLGLSVAITGVVILLSHFASKSAEARKQAKAFNDAVVESAFKPIASLQQLSSEWSALGNNIKAKEKFIQDNSKKFDELGVSISNVNDAENLFVNNKEKFIESLILRAKALAATDLAAQKYKEALEKQLELDKTGKTFTKITSRTDPETGRVFSSSSSEVDNPKYTKIEKEKAKLEKEGMDLFKKAVEFTEQEKKILKDIGASSTNIVEGSIAALEASISRLKEKLRLAVTDKDRDALQKQIKSQEKLLAKMNPSDKNELENERKKAIEDLKAKMLEQTNLRRDLTMKERETVVEAMKDGFNKEMAELQLEHEQKLIEIANYEQKLLEVQNQIAKNEWIKAGKKAADYKPSVALNNSDKTIISNMAAAESARFATAQGNVYNVLLDKYKDFDQQKKEIDAAYLAEYNSLTLLLNGKNTDEIIAKQKKLKQEWKKTIDDLQMQVLKDFKLDGLLDNASGYIMDKVKEVLPFFHSISEASLSELKTIQGILDNIKIPDNVIEELKKKGVDVKLLQKLIDELKKAAKEGTDQVEEKTMDKYVNAAKLFGDALSQSGDEFVKKIGGLVTQIASTIGTMTSKSATGFDKASSIIGLAITVGNYLKSIRIDQENKEINAQKDINKEIADRVSYETEINRLYAERQALQQNSVFLGKNYAEIMSDAMGNIVKYNAQLGTTLDELYGSAIFTAEGQAKRNLFGTKKGEYEFSLLDVLRGNAPKSEKGGIGDAIAWLGMGTGIADHKVTNDFRKLISDGDWMGVVGKALDPWNIFGGGDADKKAKMNAFENLTKSVTEALKAMGKSVADFSTMSTEDMLTFFSLMEKSGNITDEGTKKLIESAKAQLEQVKKAQEEMKAAISEIAGSLGGSIETILEDAFRNGFGYGPEQAKKAATEISKILEDMLSSMIYQQAFAGLFKQLEEGMGASFGANGDKSWIDDFKTFMAGIPAAAAMFNEGMTEAQKAAKAAGFDIFGKGTDSSASGAIKGISSQEANVLAGQTNAMRINQVDGIQVMRNQLMSLNEIKSNTAKQVDKLIEIINIMKSGQTDPFRGQGM